MKNEMQLVQFLIKTASKFIDRDITEKILRDFLDKSLKVIISNKQWYGYDKYMIGDLINIYNLLKELGYTLSYDLSVSDLYEDSVSQGILVNEWMKKLENDKVIHRNIVVHGSGRYLDLIDEIGEGKKKVFVKDNVELLLRHVEVKRRRCLNKFSPELSIEQSWIEKHEIAILFSRYARRNNDLRMLNAAFKLNDWSFPFYERMSPSLHLVKYIISLGEQEKSVKEMMDC